MPLRAAFPKWPRLVSLPVVLLIFAFGATQAMDLVHTHAHQQVYVPENYSTISREGLEGTRQLIADYGVTKPAEPPIPDDVNPEDELGPRLEDIEPSHASQQTPRLLPSRNDFIVLDVRASESETDNRRNERFSNRNALVVHGPNGTNIVIQVHRRHSDTRATEPQHFTASQAERRRRNGRKWTKPQHFTPSRVQRDGRVTRPRPRRHFTASQAERRRHDGEATEPHHSTAAQAEWRHSDAQPTEPHHSTASQVQHDGQATEPHHSTASQVQHDGRATEPQHFTGKPIVGVDVS